MLPESLKYRVMDVFTVLNQIYPKSNIYSQETVQKKKKKRTQDFFFLFITVICDLNNFAN